MLDFFDCTNLTAAREFLRERITSASTPDLFVFDGFEPTSLDIRLSDPLHRIYLKPRYNPQTLKFVTSLGGIAYGTLVLKETVQNASEFKAYFTKDEKKLCSFLLIGYVNGIQIYVRVYQPEHLPIVIMHDVSGDKK